MDPKVVDNSPHSNLQSQRSAVCNLIRINFSGAVGMMGHKNLSFKFRISPLLYLLPGFEMNVDSMAMHNLSRLGRSGAA